LRAENPLLPFHPDDLGQTGREKKRGKVQGKKERRKEGTGTVWEHDASFFSSPGRQWNDEKTKEEEVQKKKESAQLASTPSTERKEISREKKKKKKKRRG